MQEQPTLFQIKTQYNKLAQKPEVRKRATRRRALVQGAIDFTSIRADNLTWPVIRNACKALLGDYKIRVRVGADISTEFGAAAKALLQRNYDSPAQMYWGTRDWLIDQLKPYCPGLTKDAWHKFRGRVLAIRSQRSGNRSFFANREAFNGRRLWPLEHKKKGNYEDFAKKVWRDRGCPTFGKRVVTGATWGPPWTNDRRGPIQRWVGIYWERKGGRALLNVSIQR